LTAASSGRPGQFAVSAEASEPNAKVVASKSLGDNGIRNRPLCVARWEMIMDPSTESILVLALWVLLPLVPSTIIYKVFPDTQVVTSGPLSGLTVRASGAFAAYLIILLITMLPVRQVQGTIDANSNGYWRVEIPLQVLKGPQREPVSVADDAVSVSVIPVEFGYSGGNAWTYVKRSGPYFPTIRVSVSGIGYGSVNLSDPNISTSVDNAHRIINVQQPVQVKEYIPTALVSPDKVGKGDRG